MFDSMVSCYLQQWMQQLIADYTHLEALRISSDANRYLPLMPAGNLLSLRHVELALSNDLDRLEPFLIGLSFCSKLEALKITDTNVNLSSSKSDVPCFSIFGAASLRQIELLGVVPGIMVQLPSQCLLRLSASQHYSSHPWESYQNSIKDFISVLWLHQQSSEAWPAGLQDYSRLQYLQLTCTDVIELSLADMIHIPHVRMDITGMASLLLTRGAWQSLEVHSRRELFLTFSDVDAFVRGTQNFLFSGGSSLAFSKAAFAPIQDACKEQGKPCYECQYRDRLDDYNLVLRMSNREDMMHADEPRVPHPYYDAPDACHHVSDSSWSWIRVKNKHLVDADDFWPNNSVHNWAAGE